MFGSHTINYRIVTLLALIFFGSNIHAATNELTISGPYQSKNLDIYLIHGKDRVENQNYLTLGEAMTSKKVTVHETSNVNQLSIENTSKSDYVYIQAGDIVKGGRQDRVFATDMILEPGSGKIDIASFCVEQGRWHKRERESVSQFSGSSKKLASRELKMATRLKKNQSDVWKEVRQTQDMLSKQLKKSVKAPSSGTSLQLTLENKSLNRLINTQKLELLPVIKGKQNVIGYAFAINGKINTADIYANEALFKKLWPKAVDAAVTESIGEYKKGSKHKTPTTAEIKQWLVESNKGKKQSKKIRQGLIQETTENNKNVRFDTYSGKGKDRKIYRQNHLAK